MGLSVDEMLDVHCSRTDAGWMCLICGSHVKNFANIKRIGGIESWLPADCHEESLNTMLNSGTDDPKFSVFSI